MPKTHKYSNNPYSFLRKIIKNWFVLWNDWFIGMWMGGSLVLGFKWPNSTRRKWPVTSLVAPLTVRRSLLWRDVRTELRRSSVLVIPTCGSRRASPPDVNHFVQGTNVQRLSPNWPLVIGHVRISEIMSLVKNMNARKNAGILRSKNTVPFHQKPTKTWKPVGQKRKG